MSSERGARAIPNVSPMRACLAWGEENPEIGTCGATRSRQACHELLQAALGRSRKGRPAARLREAKRLQLDRRLRVLRKDRNSVQHHRASDLQARAAREHERR